MFSQAKVNEIEFSIRKGYIFLGIQAWVEFFEAFKLGRSLNMGSISILKQELDTSIYRSLTKGTSVQIFTLG